jgi:Cu2+-exporting ATPase
MDLPVALGLSVGTIVGTANATAGKGDVYFDSLAVLVFLLLIGRWIQFRQQHRAAKSVDLLLRITPRHANLKNSEGEFELVLAETLRPDDIVRVSPGDSIPTDGVIEAGESLIDRSLLTGESKPVPALVGDEVSAGTVNLRQPIDVRVEAVGADSRVGRVMKSVEEAMAEKTPIVQLADRVGGVFVIVVTLLAGATFFWWLGRGPTLAASHATALLIVACPCALALATPLAIAVSLGRAAKQKILIRDGSTFQRLARPGSIWFDKTGTLTQGRVTAEFVAGDAAAIGLAAAIERECNHPIADAVVRLAGDSIGESSSAQAVEVRFGGVTGQFDERRIAVGNAEFLASLNCAIDDHLKQLAKEVAVSGWSPILIAVDDQVVTIASTSRAKYNRAASETGLEGRNFIG